MTGPTFFDLDFDVSGRLVQSLLTGRTALGNAVAAGEVDDIFFFAHGWNAGASSTRALHRDLFAILATLLPSRAGRTALVSVNWPSLLLPEDDPSTRLPTSAGGAQLANSLAPAFPKQQFQLDELGELLDRRPASITELERFHELAGRLVSSPSLSQEDSGEAGILSADTLTLFGHAAAMSKVSVVRSQNRADPFPLLWSGAREVLRAIAYYEMKNRAGVIGKDGLGPLLADLRSPHGRPRCHLIGHSYGARLMAYSLAGLPTPGPTDRSPVKSLYLIQGALSHFAFTKASSLENKKRIGSLAEYANRVDGPLLASFSSNDRCLGWWYPSLSLLSHQDAGSVSELAHRWGALGYDGFQDDAVQQVPLAAAGAHYGFQRGGQYALDGSAVIRANQSVLSGAHSDIRHPEVLWPIVAAAGFDAPAPEPKQVPAPAPASARVEVSVPA